MTSVIDYHKSKIFFDDLMHLKGMEPYQKQTTELKLYSCFKNISRFLSTTKISIKIKNHNNIIYRYTIRLKDNINKK